MTREPSNPPIRLASQTSPYLLQHAHNPVDWWPWCDEAFEEARKRNVPVFLSIGYSTCYWCHVMERECFENAAIAAQMNKDFICIKVDREERPDVDEVYMAATVMMTSRGGWPMSVFLEPAHRRPFWCGTYFPPEPRHGMPSFPQVLASLAKAYREQQDAVAQQSEEVAAAIREHLSGQSTAAQLGQEQVAQSVQALLKIFDRVHGGFGNAPKFPQPVFLEFLLDARERAADDATADAIDQALRTTLNKMACGGIYDHVGGGFHRYAVDGVWLVPHFEKMLYDNAQLARVYARAARWFGDKWYEQVARDTLAYVQREMTGEGGGFFSAQDAEVDGREGLNYLWTHDEVFAALGSESPEDADFAIRVYGLDQGPNFKDPHHQGEPARNVLRLEDRPDRICNKYNLSPDGFLERLASINQRLYAARRQRKQPRLDDKVLAAWNGLMISAFATAARELEDPSLLAPAEKAAAFVLAHLTDSQGQGGERRLLRNWREGRASTPAFLEDHAFMIEGLLDLHRAARNPEHLAQARALLAFAQPAFFDDATGNIFDTRPDSELFVRTRSTHDGATPAGISVMLHGLLDLAELTGNQSHRARAMQAMIAISGPIAENPVGAINSTRALLRLLVEDPGATARLQAVPNAAAPRQQPSPDFLPVEIYASLDRVGVSESQPAELTLVVNIADGYHVPAADPGDSPAARALIPFRIGIINGTGIAAYAGYPPGEPYGDEPIRVYQGRFELPVALERKGQLTGRPLISVMYQACTDTECLAPVTVELDIAIDAQ